MGSMDDGTGPAPEEDLVITGAKIVLAKMGSNSAGTTIDGAKVTFKDPSATSVGFYYEFPEEAEKYPNVIVYFKVIEVNAGRPGLLVKNSDLSNYTGIVDNDDPHYQLNDVGLVGTEFNTGTKKTAAFKGGRIGFQHQAWNPGGNSNVDYTIEVTKIVFPGSGAGEVINYLPPDNGTDFFHVNLNDFGTQGIAAVAPNDLVTGTVAIDKVTLKFTKENQRAHFKLTPEQNAILTEASANGSVTITLTGKATYTGTIDASKNGGALFRFGMANPATGTGWNGTGLTVGSPASGDDYTGTVTGFDATNKSAATLGYFTIQARQAFDIDFEIESVKIAYTIPVLPNTVSINSTVIGSPEAGSNLIAIYAGPGPVSYQWTTNDGTVVGNTASLFVPKGQITSYKVTVTVYGYKPGTAVFDSYDVRVSIPLYFGAVGDTATAGTLLVVPELGGSTETLAVGSGASVVVETDNSGFTFTYGTTGAGNLDYENAYTQFSIDFPVANTFATPSSPVTPNLITKVTLTYAGLDGDSGWKTVRIIASGSKLTGKQDGTPTGQTNQVAGAATGNQATATIDLSSITPGAGGKIWFALFANAGNSNASGTTTYKITDVTFGN